VPKILIVYPRNTQRIGLGKNFSAIINIDCICELPTGTGWDERV
jgi:hypothetical protein